MKEVSIKKLIIFLISFIVVAVAITAVLITINKNNNINSSSTNYISGEKNNNGYEKIIGTKRNQKFNQNDLEIIRENAKYDVLEYQTIRISGLKNKEIENKINKELEDIEADFRQKVIAAPGENGNMYLSSFVTANFSNILSVTFYGSKADSNYRNEVNIHKYLNYDLTTGNKIKMEDIFLHGTDIDMYAQDVIYKNELHEKFSEKDIFFNQEYWQSGELQYVLDEIDEADFMKKYNLYKNSDKDFYIAENGIDIKYSEDINSSDVYIQYKDCLDDLVVYTKFLTKESIFEKDDVGLKDLYVCSSINLYSDNSVYLIKDLASNLRIDARINIMTPTGYNEVEFFKNTLTKLVSEINDKKEEYIKLANANKDQYYFIGILYDVNDYNPQYYLSSYEDKRTPTYDKFIVYKQEKTYNVSMQDFSDWFEDKLIENYTGSKYTIDYLLHINMSDEEKAKCNIKEETSSTIYNLNYGTSTSDLSGIFADEIDYTRAISEVLKEYENVNKTKIEEIIANHKYVITQYSIIFKDTGKDICIDYDRFHAIDFK